MPSRQTILIIALIAVLGGAVGFHFWNRHGTVETPSRFLISGVCLACGKDVNNGDTDAYHQAPWVCPHCGKQAVYVWAYCEDCDYRFVPPPSTTTVRTPDGADVYRPPMIPRCPVCPNGGHATAWYPKIEEVVGHPEKGKRPLPPWPGARR